ncbi:ATP-dependent Clp protease ATP-binding subunit, partial [Candidatus Microgenomates bacterium]|nr:ATP-dependent Clp protease ATP-binding subunit [Candidatus Microgenomates bacterium]
QISFPAAKLLVLNSGSKELIQKLVKARGVKLFLQKSDIGKNEVVAIDVNRDELTIKAEEITRLEGGKFITIIDLFVAYLFLSEKTTKLLFKKELKTDDALHIAYWTRLHFPEEEKPRRVASWGQGMADSWVAGWTLETKKYTNDFTKKTLRSDFTLESFSGREKELELLTEALSKSQKQNALLIGQPGVGKTTIIKALASKIFLGEVPQVLKHKRILELSVGGLVAGAENQGILEERIKNIIDELEHAESVILYISDLQNLAGATSLKLDATGVFLPMLRGDKIQVVATTTPEYYKSFIETKKEFADTLDKVEVAEPTRNQALRMLLEATLALEKKCRVSITYQAVVTAGDLAKHYLPGRFLPGKAIDLLDEAAAKTAFDKQTVVDKEQIVELIETKTHVAVGIPKTKEREMLLKLEEIMHKNIIDQEEAVKVVAQALRRLRGGVAFEDRPVGTFLFLGPTGVGKTETAKTLARVYFGSVETMLRFDMSEYQNEASVTRLLDELVDKLLERPFSLVLLDEFEKAHPKVLDIFLQVFEDGRLTDTAARTASFINAIIIATSNAGAELIREKLSQGESLQTLKPEIIDQLQRLNVFKPELVNRFDAVVLFEPLGEKEIAEVTKLMLAGLTKSMSEKEITLRFEEPVVAKIAKEGFNIEFGARPIRRFIQDKIENLLADKILKQEVKRGDTVTFSTDSGGSITLSVI